MAQASDERYSGQMKFYATLGKFLPVSTAKMQPPWAEHNFSHRFSGDVPVEVYEQLMMDEQSRPTRW